MTLMLLFLLISAGNFCLGFALAVHFGHGPQGIDLATPVRLLHALRARVRGKARAGR